jgi:hypothetical protein
MPTYHRTADVEFAIHGSQQNVTVRGIPYCVTDGNFDGGEVQASIDAISYLREIGVDGGLSCVSVCSSPVRFEIDMRFEKTSSDLIDDLKEVRSEITNVNRAAGETIFNPAATDAIDAWLRKLNENGGI